MTSLQDEKARYRDAFKQLVAIVGKNSKNLLSLDELRILKATKPNTILVNIFGKEVRAADAFEDDRAGLTAYRVKK